MRIVCHTWPTCQHTEHLDPSGLRVGLEEIRNEANRPIAYEAASYPCPACTDPDGNHDGIGIRPVQQLSIVAQAPSPMAAENTQHLNPQVAEFRPVVQPQTDHYVDPDGTNGNITAMQSDSNYDSINGTTYNSYASNSTNAPFGDNHQAHRANGMNIPNYPSHNIHDTFNHHFSHHGSHNADHYSQRHGSYNADHYGNPAHTIMGAPNTHLFLPSAPSNALVVYDPSVLHQLMPQMAPKDEHRPGKSCPQGSPFCHWHYARHCHEDPVTCRLALQAITAAFHAHGPWKDAPSGWNDAHQECIRIDHPKMCSILTLALKQSFHKKWKKTTSCEQLQNQHGGQGPEIGQNGGKFKGGIQAN